MISLVLSTRSGAPAFVQLERQVRQAIRLGSVRVGDQLPTVKDVAVRLAINPNTVLKAYRELERQGLVEPRVGLGTFVTSTLGGADPAAVARHRRQLARWIRAATGDGLDYEDITAMFEAEMAAADQERAG